MKKLEISLGLFAGYLLAGLVNMIAFDKTWKEAFSDEKVLASLAGIALSIYIFQRKKKQQKSSL